MQFFINLFFIRVKLIKKGMTASVLNFIAIYGGNFMPGQDGVIRFANEPFSLEVSTRSLTASFEVFIL